MYWYGWRSELVEYWSICVRLGNRLVQENLCHGPAVLQKHQEAEKRHVLHVGDSRWEEMVKGWSNNILCGTELFHCAYNCCKQGSLSVFVYESMHNIQWREFGSHTPPTRKDCNKLPCREQIKRKGTVASGLVGQHWFSTFIFQWQQTCVRDCAYCGRDYCNDLEHR